MARISLILSEPLSGHFAEHRLMWLDGSLDTLLEGRDPPLPWLLCSLWPFEFTKLFDHDLDRLLFEF